jgi:ubiquinone/menaquinone biosynthesis C-methylase UbiE
MGAPVCGEAIRITLNLSTKCFVKNGWRWERCCGVGSFRNFAYFAAAQCVRKRIPKTLDLQQAADCCVLNLRVLDVAAGSGVWSLALARRDSGTRVTVADSTAVIEKVTRRFAAREGVAEQYDYLPGDLRDLDFGEAAYDVAILGHICHGIGAEASKQLFIRLYRALKTGGQLLIAEIIPDDERREALFPLLFAVTMLAQTPEGDTFTMSEYRQWLRQRVRGSFHDRCSGPVASNPCAQILKFVVQ